MQRKVSETFSRKLDILCHNLVENLPFSLFFRGNLFFLTMLLFFQYCVLPGTHIVVFPLILNYAGVR